MFKADAWRIWWWGCVVSLAHCNLHVVCLHLKYRIHRCILWSEPSSMLTRSPTILCLPFLSNFVSSGSPFLVYIFFSGSHTCVSPGAASSLPCHLFHTQMWLHSHWSVGKLLAQRHWSSWLCLFCPEVEPLQTPVILALQFKLRIFLLFLF